MKLVYSITLSAIAMTYIDTAAVTRFTNFAERFKDVHPLSSGTYVQQPQGISAQTTSTITTVEQNQGDKQQTTQNAKSQLQQRQAEDIDKIYEMMD